MRILCENNLEYNHNGTYKVKLITIKNWEVSPPEDWITETSCWPCVMSGFTFQIRVWVISNPTEPLHKCTQELNKKEKTFVTNIWTMDHKKTRLRWWFCKTTKCKGVTFEPVAHWKLTKAWIVRGSSYTMIYVIPHLICTRFTMFKCKVVPDPGHKMIFKCALNQLVKDIRGQYLINIITWKIIGK